MKVCKFEDLEIWQEARELYKMVYEITLVKPFSSDFKLRDQIRSAAGSVADNISEGFERGGNNEFIQFLYISKGSCAEVRSQTYRAYDCEFITENQFKTLLEKTDRINRKISNLVKHLKNSTNKGPKYND